MVVALVIGVTIVATLIAPLSGIVGDNTGTVGVNETATIHTNEMTDLTGYDITANFTLENDSGSTLSEGTDYQLYEENGSIEAVDGSANVADGETVTAIYEYQATSGTTTTIVVLVPLFVALLVLGLMAVGIQELM